ncbi:MAG: response regulator, partial [Coriobacteriia bacterium]|nr:response regulator [Coriobacteriia bacterium]
MSENRKTTSVGRRVLIIDDDEVLLAGLQQALVTQGYTVEICSDGERGLATHPVFQPDLIVLDVMMPSLDGWAVLERLRSSETDSHVPIIMLTADAAVDSKIRGFELGADDYLTKPFSIRELRCRVAAVLRRTDEESVDAVGTIPVVVETSDIELLRTR